ncbi:uncharacterized protein LOC105781494 [Gossypium raimondii]|uniref:uncharacterized protein LOC105781494 n=1 Tax=Gossypium raimondii TaxID=29730 RepID=UPI00063A90DA|nr:uncharacterized protein LOC105781494 [Gossypium raimondii]
MSFRRCLPRKKVLRFDSKDKLNPRFIGPYQVLRRVGLVAYQLELPPELDRIHDIFHVSMLICYQSDPSHVVLVEEIELKSNLSFEEELIQTLDRWNKVLRRKTIPLVKFDYATVDDGKVDVVLDQSGRTRSVGVMKIGEVVVLAQDPVLTYLDDRVVLSWMVHQLVAFS